MHGNLKSQFRISVILQEELREERRRLTTALLFLTARRQSSLTATVKVTEILTEIISVNPVSLFEVQAVVHQFSETIAF